MDRAYVECPCGFRADDEPGVAVAAFRAHRCDYYRGEITAIRTDRNDAGMGWR